LNRQQTEAACLALLGRHVMIQWTRCQRAMTVMSTSDVTYIHNTPCNQHNKDDTHINTYTHTHTDAI